MSGESSHHSQSAANLGCWVEVNLDAVRHNFRALQKAVGDTKVIAVIKANAYGLGAVEVGRALATEGAAMLAVTRLDEAIPLRDTGIAAPILLLTPPLPGEENEAITRDLTCCVASTHDAQRLSQAATQQNKSVRVHLKINTGMGRLGVEPESAVETAKQIAALPNIQIEAAFTHFAFAGDNDAAPTQQAFARLQNLIEPLRAAGVPQFHCCNSSATLRFPEMRLDFVRPGTVLFGQFPSASARAAGEKLGLQLRDPFSVKARVLTLREIQAGQTLGYGGEWKATRPTKIATLVVGWADGLTMEPKARTPNAVDELKKALAAVLRRNASTRYVTLCGQRAPILGRIAMQQCSVDVSNIQGVEVGETATLSMRRTSAGAHLPRVYVD